MLSRMPAVILVLALGSAGSGAELTLTFQQEKQVAGRPYYGATDYAKHRYPHQEQEWRPQDIKWHAYGPVPLGETYSLKRMVTVFDIGPLPRGTVTKALLTYTIHYEKDVAKADWCKVYSTGAPFLEDGKEIASGEIPAGGAGQDKPVRFDVTEYLKGAGASVAFEIRSAHDRYLVGVWSSGKWGPWARANNPVGSPEFFPRLDITVSVDRVPAAPVPVHVGTGEKASFGGEKGALCSFVLKPGKSRLTDASIRDSSFVPDAPGEYVVKIESVGVLEYATVTVRPIKNIHPRLAIDLQAVARLKKLAEANDPGWLKLKSAADGYCAKQGVARDYAAWGYRGAIETLTMAYLITDDKKYAAKAIEAMEICDKEGLPLVSSDAGYCMRTYGPAVAIGYDRLYSVLTPEQKEKYWKDLNYWLAWYAAAGYQSDGPAMGNYFSGHFIGLYMAAYATYGDNPLAPTLMDKATNFFDTMIAKQSEPGGPLEGGDDPEGRYAGNYYDSWFTYLITRKLAGECDAGVISNWPKDVCRSYIHRTRSDEKTFYDFGAWRDQEPSWITVTPMLDLSCLLAGTPQGEYAQQYVLKFGKGKQGEGITFSAIFDPNRKASSWDGQPCSYFSPGLGLATARSSWEKGAVWVAFQGAGTRICDHQHRDSGYFEIFRGTDELLKDTNTDDGGFGSEYHNCLLVDVPKDVSPNTPGQYDNGKMHTVTSYEDTGGAVVMTSDLIANYTNLRIGKPYLKSYKRTHAYVRPNVVVVIDSFQPLRPEWPAYGRLNFTGGPDIAGTMLTGTVGESKLVTRFFGSPVTLEKVHGDKLLQNSINCKPLDPNGPKTIVMVFHVLGKDEPAPAVSVKTDAHEVVVEMEGGTKLVLNGDGSPGGSVTVKNQTRILAGKMVR